MKVTFRSDHGNPQISGIFGPPCSWFRYVILISQTFGTTMARYSRGWAGAYERRPSPQAEVRVEKKIYTQFSHSFLRARADRAGDSPNPCTNFLAKFRQKRPKSFDIFLVKFGKFSPKSPNSSTNIRNPSHYLCCFPQRMRILCAPRARVSNESVCFGMQTPNCS